MLARLMCRLTCLMCRCWHVFCVYFACIMILAHCGLDPYFALATNNMSDQIPCDQALISGGESAGFTNMTNSSRMI